MVMESGGTVIKHKHTLNGVGHSLLNVNGCTAVVDFNCYDADDGHRVSSCAVVDVNERRVAARLNGDLDGRTLSVIVVDNGCAREFMYRYGCPLTEPNLAKWLTSVIVATAAHLVARSVEVFGV